MLDPVDPLRDKVELLSLWGGGTQMRAAVGWVLWEPGVWMNEEGEISGRRGCEV